MLVHLRGGLGAGGYALLRRSNATLHGRFLSWPDPPAPAPGPVRLAGGTRQCSTPVDPTRLTTHRAFALLAQLRLPPGTCRSVRLDGTGGLATYLTAPDGSWAEIAHRVGPRGVHDVRTSPSDVLIPALCAAWAEAAGLGHPLISQFGVTVRPGGTRIWHRDPVHGVVGGGGG
ncbi:hypothetical protein BJF78_21700 [Pseudonocardia sp. CNS-139]|nr:hypothetical protein BJF78_21700 [Pseudonocardia sp. CNS-139]